MRGTGTIVSGLLAATLVVGPAAPTACAQRAGVAADRGLSVEGPGKFAAPAGHGLRISEAATRPAPALPLRTTDETAGGLARGVLPSLATGMGSLLVVLGLFLGAAWFWRRTVPPGVAGLPREVVETLGEAPLGEGGRMHLVRLGKSLLLVADSPAGASPLARVDDPHEVERLAALCRRDPVGAIRESAELDRRPREEIARG